MTNFSLSNEHHILNRIDEMTNSLYKGIVEKDDIAFSIKTIKNLLLEIYLIRQELDGEKLQNVDNKIETMNRLDKIVAEFESNKPF